MWGHYAKSFTGFVIKFKNDQLLKSVHLAIRSHVSYLKNYEPANPNFNKVRNEFRDLDIDSEFKENSLHLLIMLHEYCWKYSDWKYEKEYRAIALNSSEFDRKLSFEKNEVQEIYIGHRMKAVEPTAYNILRHILKTEYSEVKVFEVKPHPLIVRLDFEPVN